MKRGKQFSIVKNILEARPKKAEFLYKFFYLAMQHRAPTTLSVQLLYSPSGLYSSIHIKTSHSRFCPTSPCAKAVGICHLSTKNYLSPWSCSLSFCSTSLLTTDTERQMLAAWHILASSVFYSIPALLFGSDCPIFVNTFEQTVLLKNIFPQAGGCEINSIIFIFLSLDSFQAASGKELAK